MSDFIEIKWDSGQPIKYYKGVELTYDVLCNFKDKFGVDFGELQSKSNAYNAALVQCNYHSDLWIDKKAKEKTLEKIYLFNLSDRDGSSITPLLPFEIDLLNKGYELKCFCELNRLHPNRSYIKEDKEVVIGYGIETDR